MTTEITPELEPYADLIRQIEHSNAQSAKNAGFPLHHHQYLSWAISPNGTLCALAPYIYTWAIIDDIDQGGFARRWCYADLLHAMDAQARWLRTKQKAPKDYIRAVIR